jgi:hypothetical protein
VNPSPGRLILQRLHKRARDARWEAAQIDRDLWDDLRAWHEQDAVRPRKAA